MSDTTVRHFNNSVFKTVSIIEIEQHILSIQYNRQCFLKKTRKLVKSISYNKPITEEQYLLFKEIEKECEVKIDLKKQTVSLKSWEKIIHEFNN